MTNFFCRDSKSVVLKVYDLSQVSVTDAILQCEQLKVERTGQSNSMRMDGEAVKLTGGWKDVDINISKIDRSSPEARQRVPHKEFKDVHAFQRIDENLTQRADYLINRSLKLDYDDKEKLMEQLFRDMSGTIRALTVDVLHLQAVVGELMVRVDSLENWDKGIDPFDKLKGGSTSIIPMVHDPIPHIHGGTPIPTSEIDVRYHQGRAVYWSDWGESPGLGRYYEALKTLGAPLPDYSPENTWSQSARDEEFM